MLNDEEMRQHLTSLKLTKEGVDFVFKVRSSPPARRPSGSHALNSTVRFVSRLMGHTVHLESSTVELAVAMELEADGASVLEYWDQIPPVTLTGTRIDGRIHKSRYVCDFLVIRKDRVEALAPKAEQDLIRLCARSPKDWIRAGTGYSHLPADAAFAHLGIVHIVRGSATLSQVYSENVAVLLKAAAVARKRTDTPLDRRIIRLFRNDGVATLSDVARHLSLRDLTPVLRLVAEGEIVADLRNGRLSNPETAWLGMSDAALSTIRDVSSRYGTALIESTGPLLNSVAAPRALSGFAKRIAALDGSLPHHVSQRTIQRYRKAIRDAGGDLRALIPQHAVVARPKSMISPEHERFIRRVIDDIYGTEEKASKRQTHEAYMLRFPNTLPYRQGESPLSFPMFLKRMTWRSGSKQAGRRGGRRAANARATPTDPMLRGLRASRPFQKAHIDHYLCDLFVVVARAGKKKWTAKPWLTLMMDEYSGEVLAYSFSLRQPNSWTAATVIRDCTRRHGRLPETIVVDQGSDFESTFFETMLAGLGIHKQIRPSAAPRFGSSLERLFGIFKQEALSGLMGNTANPEGRTVSGTHQPRRLAQFTLEDLYVRAEDYFIGHLNKFPRGVTTIAPEDLTRRGLERYSCSGVSLKYDLTFLVATSPPAPRRRYRLDRTRGIRVLGSYYWSPALVMVSGAHVTDVRIDSSDKNIVYVGVEGRWHVAMNQSSAITSSASYVHRLCETTIHIQGRPALHQVQKVRREGSAILTKKARRLGRRRRTEELRTRPPIQPSPARHREITEKLPLTKKE